MDLIEFRVTMYKGIIDSGWVDVDRLTVLVGKNESGKTSLLKALHKLNPYTPDPYQINKEWPRGRQSDRTEEQVVCRAKFQLSDQEKYALAQIGTRVERILDTVEVSRSYAGQLGVDFGEGPFDGKLARNAKDIILDELTEILDELNDQFKRIVCECLREALYIISEDRITELTELAQKYEALLREAVSSSDSLQQTENNFINRYISNLESCVSIFRGASIMQSEAYDYIAKQLPTFVYMDDYRAFSGTAALDAVQNRRDNDQLTEEDRTFLMILELSGLNLDELVQHGAGR